MSSGQKLKLFCYILGKYEAPFPVDIAHSETVGDLKKAIFDQNRAKLVKVDANQLKLWKYYIPGSRDLSRLENLQLHDQDSLDDFDLLSSIFSDAPQRYLHVLVQAPPASPPLRFGPNIVRRNDTVQALYERLSSLGFVQVQGTPASGKTTLASLLYDHIVRCNPASNVSFITWNVDLTKEQWKGHSRPSPFGPHSPTFLIVDEAQGSYGNTDFWQFIKSINSFSFNRVILFCSYGSPSTDFSDVKTPMVVGENQRISLQPVHYAGSRFTPVGLLLQQNEYDDLVGRWSLTAKLSESLRRVIFEVTAGHVGAIVDFMTFIKQTDIYHQMKNGKAQCITLEQFFENTSHADFVTSIVDRHIVGKDSTKASKTVASRHVERIYSII